MSNGYCSLSSEQNSVISQGHNFSGIHRYAEGRTVFMIWLLSFSHLNMIKHLLLLLAASLLKMRSDKQVAATLVTAVSNGPALINCSSTSEAIKTNLANKLP